MYKSLWQIICECLLDHCLSITNSRNVGLGKHTQYKQRPKIHLQEISELNAERSIWIDCGVGVNAEGSAGHYIQAVGADKSKRKVIVNQTCLPVNQPSVQFILKCFTKITHFFDRLVLYFPSYRIPTITYIYLQQ